MRVPAFASPSRRLSHHIHRALGAVLLAAAAAAPAAVLSSAEVQARTGQSIDQWGAAWWQWAFANPQVLGDSTGAFGPLGDVGGPVFFAEGSTGDPLTLSYAVPGNQFILLPVATYLWTFFDPCADAGCATSIVNTYADAITQPFATIDGTPVTDFGAHLVRVDPGAPLVFQVDAGPIDSSGYGGILDAVESGYWLMLDPLGSGTHDIVFGATVPLTDPDSGQPLGGTADLRTELAVAAVPEPSIAAIYVSGGLLALLMRRRRRRT